MRQNLLRILFHVTLWINFFIILVPGSTIRALEIHLDQENGFEAGILSQTTERFNSYDVAWQKIATKPWKKRTWSVICLEVSIFFCELVNLWGGKISFNLIFMGWMVCEPCTSLLTPVCGLKRSDQDNWLNWCLIVAKHFRTNVLDLRLQIWFWTRFQYFVHANDII